MLTKERWRKALMLPILTKEHWKEAVKMTFPVFAGYIAIGIPFGLMCVAGGYPLWLAPVMSVFMYAGAGEYVAVGLFVAGSSLATVAVTQLLVNLRHIVYGLSLIDRFKSAGRWKGYLVFALTDETYSLLTSCRDRDVMRGEEGGEFCGAVALLNQVYWIAGSTIGAVAGGMIPFGFEGVDFALTALFAVLLVEQVSKGIDEAKNVAVADKQVMAIVQLTREHGGLLLTWRQVKSVLFPPMVGAVAAAAAIVASKAGLLAAGNILIVAMALGLAILVAAGGKPITGKRRSVGDAKKGVLLADDEAEKVEGCL